MVFIPQHRLEGRPGPFPAGTYRGKLNKVTPRWSEDGANLYYSLEFVDMTELETNKSISRPYRPIITAIFNGQSVVDVTDVEDESVPFQLRQSLSLLGSLAVAVGAATVSQGGVDFSTGEFLQKLEDGAFNGIEVAVRVGNREYTARDGSKRVSDGPEAFYPVATALAETEQTD